jgi:SAM-dependent methyltransferase
MGPRAKWAAMDLAARTVDDGEYVRDVPYPRRFTPQIAPQQLRLVAAMNGIATPPEDDFDYCELGCGNGDTLALLAAANPDARFVGVDFNQEHVACARSLASRAGLENVRVLPASFEGLRDEELPDFDFIVAHGVLSWVGPTTWDAVLAFARTKLKAGGLLYVSYNALPGWAAIEPLRRLMVEHTEKLGGSSLDRAREGLAFAQRLADAGVAFFTSHPTAKSMLSLMRAAGLPYVVHEYFNAHLRPFYFADVAREMKEHGLSFVGQLPLHLNVPELSIPPSIRKLTETMRDRVELETLKDFATNELFRSEVYVRGDGARSVAEMRAYFETTPFGLTVGAVQREVRLPLVTVEYKTPAYDAILAELARGPASATELATRGPLAALGASRIGDCVRNLVLGGQVVPMRAERANVLEGERVVVRPPFNDVALDEALAGDGPLALASPVTGTGLHLALLEAIALRFLTKIAPADRDAWTHAFAGRQEWPMKIGERKLKDEADLARALTKEVERMQAILPKLADLGVVG